MAVKGGLCCLAGGMSIELWHAVVSRGAPGGVERCCENWLEREELERADRFAQPTSRNQHVVGRGMARRLLGGEQTAPEAIRFEYLAHGKPQVCSPEVACRPFNVAHTDGLVICGIGEDPQLWIGVDVERQDRRTDPGLAERYFSPPEVALLQGAVNEAERRRLFLRIWTLKEAFIKAIGTGLQTPLADFAFVEVESDAPRIRWIRAGLDHGRDWQFRSLEPSPGYIAALAIGAPGEREESRDWARFEPEGGMKLAGSSGPKAGAATGARGSLTVASRSFNDWLAGSTAGA